MRAVDIIIKKRDREQLTRQEIEFFVRGYTNEEISRSLDCAVGTVERRLARIRQKWSKEVES